MGCVQSYLRKRARAYRVNEPPELLTQDERGSEQQSGQGVRLEQAKELVREPAKAKPKLDPKDFMFCNLTGESRVKLPGYAR
jgi:hypothetical protein